MIGGNKHIGNYRILDNVMGEGAFGKVKKGINVLTGQKVAIKILGKKLIKEEGLYDKMKREIRILKNQFMHPNIVKVYDFIDTKADLYIICER